MRVFFDNFGSCLKNCLNNQILRIIQRNCSNNFVSLFKQFCRLSQTILSNYLYIFSHRKPYLHAQAAAISDVFFVVLPVPHHILKLVRHIRAYNARELLVRWMRLHVLHHFVVTAKHRVADDTEVLVVVGTLDQRLLK